MWKTLILEKKVIDPYRWLEDDQSTETEAWVKSPECGNLRGIYILFPSVTKSKHSRKAMESWTAHRPLSCRWVYLYYKNNGLQNQDVLYRKGKDGKEELFLDPNGFAADGTTSLAEVNFSKDGSLVCYLISEGGSDWRKAIVMNTQTREQVGDTHCKYQILRGLLVQKRRLLLL